MARTMSLVIRNLVFTLEEPALRRRFGGAYLEYRHSVRAGSRAGHGRRDSAGPAPARSSASRTDSLPVRAAARARR